MKISNRFIQFFAASAVVGSLFVASARAEDIEQAITILKVTGNARYSNDQMKSWHQCRRGDQLKPGTLIQTAENGQIDVMLGEKVFNPTTPLYSSTGRTTVNYAPDSSGPRANVVHLYPSTVMVVDKLLLQRTQAGEVSETQLDLRAGKILGNVKKLSGGSRYEIKIPNGVAGIRGTTYLIGANGTVFVLTGSVVISYVDNAGNIQTITVMAGSEWNPHGDNAGSPSMIPPGELRHIQIDYNNLPNPPSNPWTPPSNPGPVIHISPN